MSGINNLLSTLPPVSGMNVSGLNPAAAERPSGQDAVVARGSSAGGDTFERGQWWKNRSGAVAENSSGNWQERSALRAYGAQMGNDVEKNADAGSPKSAENDTEAESPEENKSVAGKDDVAQNGKPLTDEERQAVAELQSRDAEVRAHEQAHLAAAGGYARGGASFEYERGPDGKKYAVGGEVPIDVGKESDPEQTIRKMRTVRAAAMAPANPSSQDRSIAARAAAGMSDAQRELAEVREDEATAKREEMSQRMESSAGDRGKGGDSGADEAQGVSAGKSLAARRYGETAANMGGGMGARGIGRAV